MKKLALILCVLSVMFLVSGLIMPRVLISVRADELDDLNGELGKLRRELDASVNATKPLEKDLTRLQLQLAAIKNRITSIEKDIIQKEKQIEKAEHVLVKQKEVIDQRINAHYKNIKKAETSLLDLLVTDNLSISLQSFFYQKKAADNDKQAILRTVLYIKNIDDLKKSLSHERSRLSAAKVEVDKQSAFFSQEVGKAKKYQSELTSKIAQVSARQKQLLAQKLGSLNLPTTLGFGALHCTDDRNLNPGFGNAFAFFTYGIPHRIGMNQYGALGRAQAGQNAEQILDAYFDNVELKKDYSADITINVQGSGPSNIEEYVKRIYEMPASWPLEALKAQAVLARTYGLNYTNNGQKEICSTQSCQVFKPEPKGGAWEQAVNDTRGWVLVQGGQPITAWYSSTDGGYTYASSDVGWSDRSWTKRLQDGSGSYNSFQDIQNNAYDKQSPCFYAAQGYRKEYGNSAWLKSEEVADIANVLMLAKADAGTQTHLSQVDRSNPDGVDTWDVGKVKEEVRARGMAPFNSVSDVSVSADFGIGRITNVTVSGDTGSKSFSGQEWKDFFNLRAPANIQIVGALFNVEKK